jgi:hypothetical protein
MSPETRMLTGDVASMCKVLGVIPAPQRRKKSKDKLK